jgi:hypothetical protein
MGKIYTGVGYVTGRRTIASSDYPNGVDRITAAKSSQ